MQDLRRIDLLAERLRNAKATALEDRHYRIAQAAAEQAKRERQEFVEKLADEIISDLLATLESAGHEPGTSLDFMKVVPAPELEAVVFNRLMEAAQCNKSTPCWYPFRETGPTQRIKLRYGQCPETSQEP